MNCHDERGSLRLSDALRETLLAKIAEAKRMCIAHILAFFVAL
jgi:hypothetical protein